MSHWFYDNPLAAAWMTKYFGCAFYVGDAPTKENLWNFYDLTWENAWTVNDGWPKFKLHPDSEHILKPKTGDLVEVLHADGVTTTYYSYFEDPAFCDWDSIITRIVERDNLPFMWPQKED